MGERYYGVNVSIPHRYDKNTTRSLFVVLSFGEVSIPHRYDKNPLSRRRVGDDAVVSIPHRYDKNDSIRSLVEKYGNVSIPHRYDKNHSAFVISF